jgi:RHS repeat-associated protein
VCFAVNPTQRAVHGFDHNQTDLEVSDMDRVTHPTTAQSRTRGPTPELLTGSSQSVTQNTKGNMLVIPTSVGANSVIDVTHQYDALGRRVARTASGSTTVFVQVDQQTICDYVSGEVPASSTYRYLYGSYIDEPIVRIATSNSETTWYYRNQQYSIIACTDPTGAATEQYVYAAYGLLTITDGASTVRTFSAINSRYTHTGREWDAALGMYHYPAGMYEATVERFCSRDPIGYAGGSECLQEYCHSNGLKFVDPMGKQIVPIPPPLPLLPFPVPPQTGSDSGDGTYANPYDGDGTDRRFCDWIMRWLHRNAVGYNQFLLDHWLAGSGQAIRTSFDNFDSSRLYREEAITKTGLKAARRAAALNCGESVREQLVQLEPARTNAVNALITPMIYGWRFWFDCHGKAKKVCSCWSPCYITVEGHCFFYAKDHVHFWNDSSRFFLPIGNMWVRDRLINACNPKAKGFDITATERMEYGATFSCDGKHRIFSL